MIILSILRDIHTKSIYFVLPYNKSDVKSEIFMELSIIFGFDGYHPIEWIIRLDKYLYGLKDANHSWFGKIKEGLEP